MIVSVFVTLLSTTVMEVAVTLEIIGGCCSGGADAFFLEPAKAGVTKTTPSRAERTKKTDRDFFTDSYFL